MINEYYNSYGKKFRKQWEEVITLLINSGYDLSKIQLTKMEGNYETRANKRNS